MWLVIILNAVCGSTFTLGKLLLHYTQPLMLITLRMLISGVGMLGYYYIADAKNSIQKKHIWAFLQIAFFGIYLSFNLEFWAMQYMSSCKAALLYNLTPFVTAIFAYYCFNERMTIKKLVGLIIGFCGFLPTLLVQAPLENLSAGFKVISLPELSLFGSVVAYSYSWVVMKKLIKDYAYSTIFVNGITMLVGGIMSLITMKFFGDIISIPISWSFAALLGLLILTGNVIFYNLYGVLLKKYTVTFLAFTGFTVPFFTALYGYFFLHETIGWDFYVSSFVVFIGLYIFYQEELRQGYIVK